MVMSALELRVAVHNAQTAQFHLETNQLRTDVSALELRVTAHKAQIAHLQLETEQLEGLLDVKKKKLMETARFAVTKMPYEVMRRIFTLCSEPIFDQAEEFGQMQIKSWKHEDIMPLVVRNVCRDWWAIVEGTPALWSTLYLSLDDVPESVVRSGAMDEFIDTWVAKAGEHPLTLVLKAAGAGDDLQLFHLRRLIQRYAGRTKRLALDIRGCYLSGLGLEDLPLPMLTRASLLHGFDLLEEGEGEEEVTLFDAAPELFWLDIGRNSWWMDREVELPWELLTTFERTVKVVEFLMLAPNLRVAKVNLESEKGGATLTHRAMQNFSCTGDLSSLEWLRLPNGLSLDIGDDEFGVLPDYSESLKDFIRAATHLEGLRIPGAAVSCLRRSKKFQRLQWLEVHNVTEEQTSMDLLPGLVGRYDITGAVDIQPCRGVRHAHGEPGQLSRGTSRPDPVVEAAMEKAGRHVSMRVGAERCSRRAV